jgi:hypothetical protein
MWVTKKRRRECGVTAMVWFGRLASSGCDVCFGVDVSGDVIVSQGSHPTDSIVKVLCLSCYILAIAKSLSQRFFVKIINLDAKLPEI